MEANIAATYTLIHRFLKHQSQNKAAEAVKKAAKAFVVLRDDIEQVGPALEDIIKEWRTKENTKSLQSAFQGRDSHTSNSRDAHSSSEDSESSPSDDSSSDSEDSSSSDSSSEDASGSESESDDTSDSDDNGGDSDEEVVAKKSTSKAAECDTSETMSSVGENTREVARQIVRIPERKSTKEKDKGPESDSPESDNSDSDCSSTSSTSDSSAAGSSSSNEDEVNENEKIPPMRTNTIKDKSPSTSESSSGSEDESCPEPQQKEDRHITKKRKTLKNGAAVTTAVATGSQQAARASQRKENPSPKVKERFQRVKVQNLELELLLNNGYEAKNGTANDYGERAHRDLIVTRGAGFRKEKNKKKRGSYRGGEITMENHSIKFNF